MLTDSRYPSLTFFKNAQNNVKVWSARDGIVCPSAVTRSTCADRAAPGSHCVIRGSHTIAWHSNLERLPYLIGRGEPPGSGGGEEGERRLEQSLAVRTVDERAATGVPALNSKYAERGLDEVFEMSADIFLRGAIKVPGTHRCVAMAASLATFQ
ncbi:unnamed protein product [Pleuronectes platessa]|uniref:Uncharacterized protein n=1 Tax=Pleuronectes platessa TaxID=8262 RepID=A0A9N7TJP0_PLEPL|nr:unnamed protein product [Pleuronectes platessa]